MTVRRPLVVQQVWRYPVKSLGGERVAASWADAHGLRGAGAPRQGLRPTPA